MGNCDAGAGNNLDPFQIILDALDKTVGTLEKQSRTILPFVASFREQGLAFLPENISPYSQIESALSAFTKEAICASKTDLEPINDFVEDCLNDALRGVLRYLRDILGNLEDAMDLIAEILALAEYLLMKLLQKLWKLGRDIYRLIGGIDGKIQCITSLDGTGKYAAQVDALEQRVDTVIDDLYLAEDGSFDHDRLMTGFNADLKTNLDAYKNRSDALQLEIQADVDEVVNFPATVNPKSKY